ncbi:AfsR/SARP family transcriptional regulator [[Kitasatospora] papulosa]|uniref:AfsR/SARP family transcriptional regulator n=1 Tax=[Kitasatospora] papulosa TaxID=1464011 RepID=UPI00403C4ADB
MARTALLVYVSKLRKHLEDHAGLAARLVSRPPGYVLELETSELDLRAFELQVSLAKSTAAAGRTNEALECWRTACDLWRGPALADLRGLPVFENFAWQLDEKRIDALEQRITMELQLGRHAGIISELRRLAAEYPLREDIHSQLMLSLYRSGRVSESLQTYHKVRDALVRELGLEPGERIKRLHQSILVRDPDLDAAPAFSRAWLKNLIAVRRAEFANRCTTFCLAARCECCVSLRAQFLHLGCRAASGRPGRRGGGHPVRGRVACAARSGLHQGSLAGWRSVPGACGSRLPGQPLCGRLLLPPPPAGPCRGGRGRSRLRP